MEDVYPQFFGSNISSEIKVIKDTELSLVFVASTASWKNVVGYFTYPTGTVPNVDNIQKVLAFPNATPINKIVENERVGALLCGHEVKLKYWNSEK